MNYTWLFLFGIAIGTVSGLLGIAGGIFIVPGLMLLFGFTQQAAQGTSLAVLTAPVLIFAALVYYHNGHVRLPYVAWIAGGLLVGACLGAYLVEHISPRALRLIFGAILLYTGFMYVLAADEAALKKPIAALPAALATLFSLIMTRVLRRKRAAPPAPLPPTEDSEYHI